jgi:hypothetical protein
MCGWSLDRGDGGVGDLFGEGCFAERVLRSLRAEVEEEADEFAVEAGWSWRARDERRPEGEGGGFGIPLGTGIGLKGPVRPRGRIEMGRAC